MKVNGKAMKNAGKALRYIRMEIPIKDPLRMEDLRVMEFIAGPKETYTKENGDMVLRRDMENGTVQAEKYIKENGKMESLMGRGYTFGRMVKRKIMY